MLTKSLKKLARKPLAIAVCLLAGSNVALAEPVDTSVDPVSVFDSRVYRDLFSTDEMRQVFSDRALVQQWLKVEAALARTQARLGIIPKSAAKAIEKATDIKDIDFDQMRKGTRKVGRGIKPVLGLIKKNGDKEVATYLHFGSTTQDIMDTATALQVKEAAAIVDKQLKSLILQLADLAEAHKNTVMLARSNGQDAIPTTFGLHLTTYMMELYRHHERLTESTSRLQAQIGSTVGTLAPYGDKGLKVQKVFAEEVGLAVPTAPWNPSRDVFAESVQTLALIDATLGRVALDINNLGRTQIDEVKEGESGASSTMPQKRNPRASEFLGGFARMGKMYNAAAPDIMSHTDTRQGSPWILEWSIIPESFMTTSTALVRAEGLFSKLIVKKDNMRNNFAVSQYFAMSEALMNKLVAKVGRSKAYSMVKKAIKGAPEGQGLRDVINGNKQISSLLSKKEIDEVLKPENYVGVAPAIVDRSVAVVRKELK